MPNCDNLNTSLNISVDDFSPIASSSQQCNVTMQQVLSNTNKSLHLLKNPDKNNQETKFDHMSTSGLWSSFEKHNSNENEQEITLTQLHNIGSSSILWNLKSWIDASEEFHKEMEYLNINTIKKQMKNLVVPFLVAIIDKEDCIQDTLNVYNSATFILRDPSGTIKAVISKDILNENEYLVSNSVVVLRNFRVLQIKKVYYIILNKQNLEAVFTGHTKVSLLAHQELPKHNVFINTKETTDLPLENKENKAEKLTKTSSVMPKLALELNITDNSKVFNNSVVKCDTMNKTANARDRLNQTSFKMPDLDFDFDGEIDCDTNEGSNPLKRQKIDVEHAKKSDSAISIDANCTDIKNSLVNVKPKQAFKFVKRKIELDNKISNFGSHLEEPQLQQTEKPDISSQVGSTTEKPEDKQIVEQVFEGLDVSCLLDDF
ncbi:uncharacterized protein [Atheta coriaria]|uniref:uncharacterized protein n=1 Tax=Dalotia coriaria TaxID=877792 RepID=UPI0031F3BFC7